MQVKLKLNDEVVVIDDCVKVTQRAENAFDPDSPSEVVVYFEEVRDDSKHITEDIDATTYEGAEIVYASEIQRRFGVIYCYGCETDFDKEEFLNTTDATCPDCGSKNYEASPLENST